MSTPAVPGNDGAGLTGETAAAEPADTPRVNADESTAAPDVGTAGGEPPGIPVNAEGDDPPGRLPAPEVNQRGPIADLNADRRSPVLPPLCRDERGVYKAAEGLSALPCAVMTPPIHSLTSAFGPPRAQVT
ncbi:hypothetical protein ACT16_13020 [Mycobacterium heckeshornense]|nr:hypothetical protein ACT16_13020 [Mycobacterium heckeshornense]